jgi:lysophosphatidylcholine acyltransferase / lyso-PAF acetyltransferase
MKSSSKTAIKGMDPGVHKAATAGLIDNDGGQPRAATGLLRVGSRPPIEFIRTKNPFINATAILSKLAWTKTILLMPLGFVRLLLFILASCALAIYILLLNLTCSCCLRKQSWVNFFYSPIRWACRFGLFLLGYIWIEERYPEGTSFREKWACLCCGPRFLRNKSIQPNILVGNHTTFMDALLIGSRVLPTAVGKADIVRMPILGQVIAKLNPILVPRTAEDKQRLPPVMDQLIKKAKAGIENNEPRSQPLIIFPEGTTVNQKHLITFQRGAFVPGVPIRPIAIEYPFCMLDVSNSPDGASILL